MALAVGVADFVEDRGQPRVGAVAEENRQRVEDVAEDSRVTEHLDACRRRQPRLAEPGVHPPPQATALAVAMIGVVETEDRPTVVTEQAKSAPEPGQLVEIEQRREDAVVQPVRPRR